MVADSDEKAADYGRSALREATEKLAATPQDPRAYEEFSARVDALMPFFNRGVRESAELQLCTLAIAPLEAGLSMTSEEQMKAYATTVWPTVLEFPVQENETTEAYVRRLCASEFALDCNNVIPERWPAVLNAKVWRALKSRVEVAFGHCLWCDDDASFTALVERTREIHVQVELAARAALRGGTPADWPLAGTRAAPLADEVVISFESGGRVTVGGTPVAKGDWRSKIEAVRGDATRIALHIRPGRLVNELMPIVADIKDAGYRSVALVVRQKAFPYVVMTYPIDARVRSAKDLGVNRGDTIQILVQALDHRESHPASE